MPVCSFCCSNVIIHRHRRVESNIFWPRYCLACVPGFGELLNDSGFRDLFKVRTVRGGLIFWGQLNEEVREDLRACIDAAIKHDEWNALVAHSTYFYRSRSHEYDSLSQAHYGPIQIQNADFRISSKRDGAANLPRPTKRHS